MDKRNYKDFDFFNISGIENYEVLKLALDASSSGITITDSLQPDNPIIYCNETFEHMTGYSREEIIGHNCRFLQKDDRNQQERGILRDAIASGTSCSIEMRNYTKDGILFWNELYMSPVKDDNGRIIYFIGVQNDITRRKKAEEKSERHHISLQRNIEEKTTDLKDTEEYLSGILETIRDCVVVLDQQLSVVTVNEHFLQTFKVSREETEGTSLYDLGNGQWNIVPLRKLLENILPTSAIVEGFEIEHDFPRIGKKIMLLNARQIRLEGKYKDRILIAIEDITERREIEMRKDDFLSIASHELKTPLTTIKGYVQIMEQILPGSNQENFKVILNKTSIHVERLNKLITELVNVSRMQADNNSLHKNEIFDFDKMVHETVEAIQSSAGNHTILIKGHAANRFSGDEAHIIQVVSNLLSNAIKYSPENTGIGVFLSKVSNYLKFSITDRGIGISQENKKRIFDRFYRVGEIQQKFPGMGTGLYVCNDIIKKHGGTLWVDSEPGQGSTFSFTLPIKTI